MKPAGKLQPRSVAGSHALLAGASRSVAGSHALLAGASRSGAAAARPADAPRGRGTKRSRSRADVPSYQARAESGGHARA